MTEKNFNEADKTGELKVPTFNSIPEEPKKSKSVSPIVFLALGLAVGGLSGYFITNGVSQERKDETVVMVAKPTDILTTVAVNPRVIEKGKSVTLEVGNTFKFNYKVNGKTFKLNTKGKESTHNFTNINKEMNEFKRSNDLYSEDIVVMSNFINQDQVEMTVSKEMQPVAESYGFSLKDAKTKDSK